MNQIGDYLALALRWVLTVLCLLCGLALGLAALILAGLDAYDWLRHGAVDITVLSALTGPITWAGLKYVLDLVPVWLFMLLSGGILIWLGNSLRLKHGASHYLIGRRHKRGARQLQRDWETRKRAAERKR